MSALRKHLPIDRGWPEHFNTEGDYSPDELLEKIRQAETEKRDVDAEIPPWMEMQRWRHPGPKAEAFFNDDSEVIAMRGPVGSGKTTSNLRSRIRRAIMSPRSVIDGKRRYKCVIARATYRQLWQTTIPSWWEVMPKHIGKWSGGRGDPVTHRIEWSDEHGPIEMIVEFLAFGESPAEITANMRGLQTTDLLLEEGDTNPVTVLTVGSGRINRYPQKIHLAGYPPEQRDYGQIAVTYNATDVENWTVTTLEGDGDDPAAAAARKAFEEEGIRINFYRQPGYGEKDMENIDVMGLKYYRNQIATMTAAGQTDDIERLVYNRNSYVVEGTPVFKRDYNPAMHQSPVPLDLWPGVPLRLGFDQGLYGACVVTQWVPPYRWQVLGEFWRPYRMTAQEFGEQLLEFLNERWPDQTIEIGFGDMAGENDTGAAGENAVWNRVVGNAINIYIHPQTSGANRIQPRLAAIRAGLANSVSTAEGAAPCLLIDPSCKGLIRGFRARYVWSDKPNPNGEKTRKPDKSKREADIMDALGYVMLSQSPVEGMPPVQNATPLARKRGGHNGGPSLDDSYEYNPLEFA